MAHSSHTSSPSSGELPKLFIGPWVGEFGIEILHWQGLARAAARSRAWGEVVVSSWPDRRFLYEDFADRFVPHIPPTHHACGARCRGYDESSQPWAAELVKRRGDVWLTPFGTPWRFPQIRALAASHSRFRDFSDGLCRPNEAFDLLIHARATNKHEQSHKNWPVRNWERLVESLPGRWSIASVGDPRGAHKIAGTEDLRGISLEKFAAYSGTARMLVGPSSGPVHFAIHCGLPVLTWMGEHRHHYYPQWNPRGVPIVCFDTWQPEVETVRARIRDLALISKVQSCPVRYLVVATKRSGHHAVVEWMTRLDPARYQVWMNDCVSAHLWTRPHCKSAIPTQLLLPKQLGEAFPRDLVVESGDDRSPRERIFSVEGAPLHLLPSLPEAHAAERIVVVLRDALNSFASYRRAFPEEFAGDGILGHSARTFVSTYRSYLNEALGKTAVLGDLAAKTVFVSYNRWQSEASYRHEVAASLGTALRAADRSLVARYGPRSSFQADSTPAEALGTLDRWREALHAQRLQAIWTACRDSELTEAECDFHGAATPLSRIEDAWADFVD